jgi:hypothetical protein
VYTAFLTPLVHLEASAAREWNMKWVARYWGSDPSAKQAGTDLRDHSQKLSDTLDFHINVLQDRPNFLLIETDGAKAAAPRVEQQLYAMLPGWKIYPETVVEVPETSLRAKKLLTGS